MRFRERIARFMVGRYGFDQLSRTMMFAGIVLWVISMFTGKHGIVSSIFYLVAWAIIIWAYGRALSKNVQKRYQESIKYTQFMNKLRDKFRKNTYTSNPNKGYRIFACPQCQQKVRIPKGKGKVEITCPRCKSKFVKRA